jgi:hypothetical protein
MRLATVDHRRAPADQVVVRCPEVGELRNRLVATDLAGPA